MIKTTVIAKNRGHLDELIYLEVKSQGHSCSLNHIDVSQVTNMASLFQNSTFQGDISEWNTSNVLNMAFMFACSTFNGNISKWNVCNVQSMESMFLSSHFNNDISNWSTSNVIYMNSMFKGSRFHGDLSAWDFHHDVDINSFFSPITLDEYHVPNMYHWFLLLKGAATEKIEWREHVKSHDSLVLSLAHNEKEAALLMHKAWFDQPIQCTTALVIPVESFENRW